MNEQIDLLYKTIEAKDKIIDEQVLEIARLKEQLEYLKNNEYLNQVKWERKFNEELVKYLQQKIDKAIEYIKKSMNNPQPFYHYLYGNNDGEVENLDVLLEILGEKNEE